MHADGLSRAYSWNIVAVCIYANQVVIGRRISLKPRSKLYCAA